MESDRRSTRVLVLTLVGVVVWLLVLWFAWATQPLTDTIVVGIDDAGQEIDETVECNTLLDESPIDPATAAVIGALEPDIAAQEPCESAHSEARALAAINVFIAIVVVAGVTGYTVLDRRSAPDETPVAEPEPAGTGT